MSYSQFGQDTFLKSCFPADYKGFFIDIGASHPVEGNNTFLFEENGWRGVCIEPIPSRFNDLQKSRKAVCMNAAVGAKNGHSPFLLCDGSVEQLSGLIDYYDSKHLIRIFQEFLQSGNTLKKITVPTITFNEILKECGQYTIDILSLDTEGSELSILQSINWELIQIKFITCECNYDSDDLVNFLHSKGFIPVKHLGCDIIFRNNDAGDFLSISESSTFDLDLYFADIPAICKSVRLDVGLSYNAPNSNVWLNSDISCFVFGFEPSPSALKIIHGGKIKKQHPDHQTPISDGNLQSGRFRLLPFAISDVKKPSFEDFYESEEDVGTSGLFPKLISESQKAISVPTISLEYFLTNFPWDRFPYIEYLKVDAQNNDLNILKSAGDYIKRFVYVTVETGADGYVNPPPCDLQSITAFMNKVGFILTEQTSTTDPTFFNPIYSEVAKNIKIYQES